jgi:hypothetical protein
MLDSVRPNADLKTDVGITALTPAQARFLAQRTEDIHLSVRASNCLKNGGIKYLGELVQYRPEDLMRLQNFGRKTLDEIIALFAKEKLSLGLCLPEWSPTFAGDSTVQSGNDTPSGQPNTLQQLNTVQCAFLAKRLDEIDLSVRTANCLSSLEIKYLGELVQYSAHELLRIHGFGTKSLKELTALFEEMNLQLGLRIPDWTPEFRGLPPDASREDPDTKVSLPCDDLSPKQKVFLAHELCRFHLSKRVAQTLNKAGIVRAGDLAVLTLEQASELVHGDRCSLRELMALLASEQLYFGIKIPDWSPALAGEWEREYSTEAHDIETHHAMRTTSKNSVPQSLEGELEGFVRQIEPNFNDRNIRMIVRFFGFDGTGKKTLERVGQEFGVTRERVRQVIEKFTRRLRGKAVYLPMFRWACNLIIETVPEIPAVLGQVLCEQRITQKKFDIATLNAVSRLLDEEALFDIVSVGNVDLVTEKGKIDWLKRVPSISRAVVSAHGCCHVEHILDDLGVETVSTADVTALLSLLPEVKWLDVDREWFTISDAPRNRLSNVVKKIMSVAPKISIAELRSAIKRVHRLDGFAPPSEILKAFCSNLPFCRVENDYVITSAPLAVAETLGDIERCYYDILRENESVMRLNALREKSLERGMNINSFYQYLTYSPIIYRVAPEIYALRGAEIPPGLIEEISRPEVRETVLLEHGWYEDGRVWISYRLNISNMRSGVFSLPASLKNIVSGHYLMQSSRTEAQTSIFADGETLTGLHRPVAIRGGEAGDVIIITFDLRQGTAEIRFAAEDGKVSELDLPRISAASLATPFENKEILLSGDQGRTSIKEWQSIANAPVNQDLKVRLQDALGRWALPSPCKLIPGKGWVDGWSGKPLGEVPVDWQDWDEPPIEF